MRKAPETKDEYFLNVMGTLYYNGEKEGSEAFQEIERACAEGALVKKQKKARWLSGKELENFLHQHNFSIPDFVIAVIDGKITPYDKAGLRIITLPSNSLPPGCKYENLEDWDEHQLIHSAGYSYKREDVKKLLGIHAVTTDIKVNHAVPAQMESKAENLLDADAYIKKRRDEGIQDKIIAVELYDKKGKYRSSYAELAHALTRETGISLSTSAWKMRGSRLCEAGKAMMNKS